MDQVLGLLVGFSGGRRRKPPRSVARSTPTWCSRCATRRHLDPGGGPPGSLLKGKGSESSLGNESGVSLRDELAAQARALLHIPSDETPEERAHRIEGYQRLLAQHGADPSGDEARLVAKLGYLLGADEAEQTSS